MAHIKKSENGQNDSTAGRVFAHGFHMVAQALPDMIPDHRA